MKRTPASLIPSPSPELLPPPFAEVSLNEEAASEGIPPPPPTPGQPSEAQSNAPGAVSAGSAADQDEDEPVLASFEMLSAPLTVIRPQDLLRLTFGFVNLQVSSGPGQAATLVPIQPAQDSFIVVEFPPQHILEQSFTGFLGDFVVARKVAAEPSRLVFRIPPGGPSVPFNLEGLLRALRDPRHELSVAPAALPFSTTQPQTVPTLRAPVDLRRALQDNVPPETAIELPFRLILSPAGPALWEHAVESAEVTRNDRTELWHTRIRLTAARENDLDPPQAHLRAVWTRDRDTPPPPARAAGDLPDARDRENLVRGSADFNDIGDDADASVPDDLKLHGSIERVIRCERLSLSALGGWLNARYDDDDEEHFLEQWLQQTVMGRDQYVRTIGRGNLYPYGHRVSFIEITERAVEPRRPDPGARLAATLRSRKYIVIQDREKVYTDAAASRLPDEGRGLPFKRVRIDLDRTPDITQGEVVGVPVLDDAFWPLLNGRPYGFPLVAVDHDDQVVSFEAPLIFVNVELLRQEPVIQRIQSDYFNRADGPAGQPARPRSRVELRRQKVAFAPRAPAAAPIGAERSEDVTTTLETLDIRFDATLPPLPAGATLPLDLPFLPQMHEARLDMPAVRQLVGPGKEASYRYYSEYLAGGFASEGQVFLQNVVPVTLAFSRQVKSSGGLATPDMTIVGLSRLTGLVSGAGGLEAGGDVEAAIRESLEKFRSNIFDPDDFFNDDAKILGSIKLKDLLGPVSVGDGTKVPQFKTRLIQQPGETLPTAIESQLTWNTEIRQNEVSVPIFEAHAQTRLSINAVLRTNLVGEKQVTRDITCSITDFTIKLLPPVAEFVRVRFNEARYTSVTGQMSRLDMSLGAIEFVGELNFIARLGELLSPGGRGPLISLTSQGLVARFFFPIPSVTIGAFSLTKLNMKVGIELPFNGDPVKLQLCVSDRENPFLVTVGIFGGGGYFAITISPRGLEALEMALEFGAAAAFEVAGIATGRVFIMAGIAYSMERRGDATVAVVTGYLRAGGEVRLFGLVSISVLFYMALSYDSGTRTFSGEASLTLQIKIAFFSKSVTLSIRRSFSGGDGGALPAGLNELDLAELPAPPVAPTIADMMDQSHWQEYCEAFA